MNVASATAGGDSFRSDNSQAALMGIQQQFPQHHWWNGAGPHWPHWAHLHQQQQQQFQGYGGVPGTVPYSRDQLMQYAHQGYPGGGFPGGAFPGGTQGSAQGGAHPGGTHG